MEARPSGWRHSRVVFPRVEIIFQARYRRRKLRGHLRPRRFPHSGINANVHSEPPLGTWAEAKRGMTAPPKPDAIDTN
jgi:hypothetical protein